MKKLRCAGVDCVERQGKGKVTFTFTATATATATASKSGVPGGQARLRAPICGSLGKPTESLTRWGNSQRPSFAIISLYTLFFIYNSRSRSSTRLTISSSDAFEEIVPRL